MSERREFQAEGTATANTGGGNELVTTGYRAGAMWLEQRVSR